MKQEIKRPIRFRFFFLSFQLRPLLLMRLLLLDRISIRCGLYWNSTCWQALSTDLLAWGCDRHNKLLRRFGSNYRFTQVRRQTWRCITAHPIVPQIIIIEFFPIILNRLLTALTWQFHRARLRHRKTRLPRPHLILNPVLLLHLRSYHQRSNPILVTDSALACAGHTSLNY